MELDELHGPIRCESQCFARHVQELRFLLVPHTKNSVEDLTNIARGYESTQWKASRWQAWIEISLVQHGGLFHN